MIPGIVAQAVHGAAAPGVVIGVAAMDSPTSTGPVNVTADLGGLTPKAAMVIESYHNAANGSAETPAIFIGTRFLVHDTVTSANTSAEDNVATTNSVRGQGILTTGGTPSAGHRVNTPASQTAIVSGVAMPVSSPVAFIPNGVTLNYATVDSVQRRALIVFFAGDELEAEVGSVDLVSNSTVDVTTVGFQPDLVFLASSFLDSVTSAANSLETAFGVALSGGAQRSVDWAENDNLAAAQPQMRMDNNAAITRRNGAPIVVAGDFDASGFSLTATGTTTHRFFWLALSLGGRPVSLFGVDTPTSAGNQSYETPGFEPQFALLVGTNLETENTTASGTNDLYGGLSINAVSADEQWSAQWRYDPGSDPADNGSLVRAGVGSPSHAAMSACLGALTFDAEGFDIDWSEAQANAKKWFALCIG